MIHRKGHLYDPKGQVHWGLHAGCMVAYPHSPGVQVMPYGAIDIWGKYSIVSTPYVHFSILTTT